MIPYRASCVKTAVITCNDFDFVCSEPLVKLG